MLVSGTGEEGVCCLGVGCVPCLEIGEEGVCCSRIRGEKGDSYVCETGLRVWFFALGLLTRVVLTFFFF